MEALKYHLIDSIQYYNNKKKEYQLMTFKSFYTFTIYGVQTAFLFKSFHFVILLSYILHVLILPPQVYSDKLESFLSQFILLVSFYLQTSVTCNVFHSIPRIHVCTMVR